MAFRKENRSTISIWKVTVAFMSCWTRARTTECWEDKWGNSDFSNLKFSTPGNDKAWNPNIGKENVHQGFFWHVENMAYLYFPLSKSEIYFKDSHTGLLSCKWTIGDIRLFWRILITDRFWVWFYINYSYTNLLYALCVWSSFF